MAEKSSGPIERGRSASAPSPLQAEGLVREASRVLATIGATPPAATVYETLAAALYPYLPELVGAFVRGDGGGEARDRSRPRLLAELAEDWLEDLRFGQFEARRVLAATRRTERIARLYAGRGLAVAALCRLGMLVEDRVETWERVPADRRKEWVRAWRLSVQFEAALLADLLFPVEPGDAPTSTTLARRSDPERLLAQLRHAEDRLATLTELVDYPIVVFGEGRVLTWVNAAAERLFGPADEVLGAAIRQILPDGDLPEEAYLYARSRLDLGAGGSGRSWATRVRKPGGETALADATLWAWRAGGLADPEASYVLLLRDLSEPGRVEEALRRSEVGFRALIEHSPDGVLVVREDRIVFANPAFLSLVDRSREEVLAVGSFAELVHPEERAAALRGYLRARSEGRTPRARPIRVLRSDGSVRQAEVVALPLSYEGATAVLVVVRDLTERLQLQARVMRADRLLTVGTLARGLSHEINNPLTYVITNVDFVLRELTHELSDPPERMDDIVEALTEAMAGADRVRGIVDALRVFTGGDDAETHLVDVARLLRSATGAIAGMARRKARIEVYEEPVGRVRASETRLGQVFLAILINAIQAIPEGSRDHRILVRVVPGDGERVVVEVIDDGVGIAPELLSRIFDPFFTTKPLGEGTGLGLSTALGIIHGLGGEIAVESVPGVGTTFRILLPAWQEDPVTEP